MKQARGPMRSGAPLMALLALAFLLRIIVPAGWMPAHGEIGFVPCPVAAPAAEPEAVEPAHHGDAHAMHHEAAKPADQPSDDHGEKKGCDFAPLGLAWTAPAPAAFDLAPGFAAARIFAAAPRAHVGQGLAAPPPPSTGPPAQS